MMKNLNKIILFDCDGTLVDTEDLSGAAVVSALKTFGLTGVLSDVHPRYIGVHLNDIIVSVNAEFGTAITAQEFTDAYTAAMMPLIAPHIRILPDTRPYIQSLQQRGYKMAIGSNGVREAVIEELAVTNLLPFFQSVVTADDVPNAKPHPDMYIKGMRDLGGNDPAGIFVLEDSVPGLKAAIAAGMIPVGYTGLNLHPDELDAKLRAAGAKTVLKSLSELDNLLG
jgi:HAD superfamily hydrolase (TIGR01509 family)